MKADLEKILSGNKILIIDGSMSTALENMGADLSSRLWTAEVLAKQPELVRRVHYNYFQAGADCGITCSYQATIPGLMAYGYSEKEAEDLITRSVELFLEARDAWWSSEGEAAGRAYPLCLGAVGPYGAYLADGSEYRGNYGISEEALRDFHARRMQLLHEAGADLLLIETQPSLTEAKIAAEIAENMGADYWISFSCRNEQEICEGDLIRDCARAFRSGYPHLRMIGVNCTKPEYISGLIRELRKGTTLPIAVYPNSGQIYDPQTKTWTSGEGQADFGAYAYEYMKAGARAVGGCCTTVETHIRQVAKARDRFVSE